MTRIISGAAGSLALTVPDAGTRPTSDRVRESLFSALEAADLIAGAAVLDLFAGSGALGLEAASRGATAVDLVEKAPRAAAIAERNARTVATAVPGVPIRAHRSVVDSYLRTCTSTYDLVFVDPPYDLSNDDLRVTLDALTPRLSADAVVIVERATRSGPPTLPSTLEHERDRSYGDTTMWWLRRA